MYGATVGIASGSVEDVDAAQLVGAAANDRAGDGLASAGDVDGDGAFDVLVGAQRADATPSIDAGAVYLLYGPIAGVIDLGDADATWTGVNTSAYAGRALTMAADFDGDLRDDVAAGVTEPPRAMGVRHEAPELPMAASSEHALNLVPHMDVILTLILAMVVATATMMDTTFGAAKVEAPAVGPGGADPTVSLAIAMDGFVVQEGAGARRLDPARPPRQRRGHAHAHGARRSHDPRCRWRWGGPALPVGLVGRGGTVGPKTARRAGTFGYVGVCSRLAPPSSSCWAARALRSSPPTPGASPTRSGSTRA